MKKTFRLAAVLVTLAALVMASCQNAAGGSGGGGGGVTPTPTPPEPEAKSVTGDAIQLVGTYKLSDYSNLILNSDGTGSISFGASASTRSIQLNDVEFTWEIGDDLVLENVYKEGVPTGAPSESNKADGVVVPYLKFNLPEGSNIKIKALSDIYYAKYIAAGPNGTPAASVKGTKKSIEGLALTLYKGGDPTTEITDLGDADADIPVGWEKLTTDPENEKITSGVGIIGVIDIDNVKTYVTDDGTEGGSSLEANPPKAADVVGMFELYSETTPGTADTADETADYYKLALATAYNTINGFDATKDISADGEYTVANGKNKADAIPVLIPAVIDVKAGGGVADVTVVIFDGANITSETEFKDDEYKLVYVPFDDNNTPADDSDDTPEKAITVKKMALLADNPGFATGVIEGCRVEIDPDGKIGINKIMDGGSTTDYVQLFAYDNTSSGVTELTPYIPFAEIEKKFKALSAAAGDKLGTGTMSDASIKVRYKKGTVTN